MPPKTSTLLKGTSVSDSRRQGAQAQRALTDTRREIKPADLAKAAAAGTKRSRENDIGDGGVRRTILPISTPNPLFFLLHTTLHILTLSHTLRLFPRALYLFSAHKGCEAVIWASARASCVHLRKL